MAFTVEKDGYYFRPKDEIFHCTFQLSVGSAAGGPGASGMLAIKSWHAATSFYDLPNPTVVFLTCPQFTKNPACHEAQGNGIVLPVNVLFFQ